MNNNIQIGNNIIIAAFDADMSVFTPDDTLVVRSVVNGLYVSYQPGRSLNSLNSIIGGQGYIIVSKVERYINFVYSSFPLLPGVFVGNPAIKFIYPEPITLAEYNSMSKNENTLYIIIDNSQMT